MAITPKFTTTNEGSTHATHVSGTLISAGTTDSARGMAYGAKLDCYEVQTEELAEMTTAASEGMLVSNHSYGPAFDTTGTILGQYDYTISQYDSVVNLAPNYLPLFAAGNDRNDAEGITWDIISGGGIAKNVLCVGAVELLRSGYNGPSSVVSAEYSCYGPADDGRIKPDIVAPGSNIYSTDSEEDDSYKSESGTSMASPGSAGSIFLLQQHYKNINSGKFMSASGLKGLVIHTCNEAGSADGPDAKFGWGLLNMEEAINVLNNKNSQYIFENPTLENGKTFEKEFIATGTEGKVTICWTDPVGVASEPDEKNNRTPRLVHDLDLRIFDENNTVIADLPWKLDYNNPSANATKGDNIVDNVEQILSKTLTANKKYKIVVSHKGTLRRNQAFSICMTGFKSTQTTGSISNLHNIDMKVFPTPVKDVINIEFNQKMKYLNVDVFSLSGEKVISKTFDRPSNKFVVETNNRLTSGVYLLYIKTPVGEIFSQNLTVK